MKHLLTALLVVAAAAAVWFAFRGDEPRSSGDAATTAAASADAPPSGQADLVSANGPDASELVAGPTEDREPAADAPAAAVDAVVTVLDDASGEPVPAAPVWLLDLGAVDRARLDEFTAGGGSTRAAFERFGEKHVTGTDGRARFRWSESEAYAYVEEGDRSIGGTLAEGGEPRLELRLPKASAVEALATRDGQPVAGVPIVLHARGEDFAFDLFARTSDAQGLVRFTGFAQALRAPDGVDPPTFYLRLGYPGSGRPARRFDSDDPPDEPIELKMRDTGPIEVRLVDSAGAALDVAGNVTLRERGADPRKSAELTGALEAGAALFPFVGTSVELEAVVEVPSRGARYTGALAERRAPNELVALTVEALERPYFTGRIVAAAGSALAPSGGDQWFLAMRDAGGRDRRRAFAPEPDGAFRVDADDELNAGEPIEVRVSRFASGEWTGKGERIGPFALAARENPLGELAVRDVPGRIAGTCVDLEGDPVAGVRIACELDELASRFVDETDPNGRFEARGLFAEPAQINVDDHQDWVQIEPVLATAGDEDVVVRVARGGSIRATLADAVELEPHEYSLLVFDATLVDPGGIDWSAWPSFDKDGVAIATGLRAGTYRCRMMRGSQQLQEIDGVAVALGVETVDPRLQRLDPDLGFLVMRLRVVDAAGRSIPGVYATVFEGERSIGGGNPNDGVIELNYLATPDLRVAVLAGGYRPVVLAAIDGERTIALERGIPVHLRSAGRPPVESGNRSASLRLHAESAEPPLTAERVYADVPLELATEGEALVTFPAPGRYRLAISIAAKPGGRSGEMFAVAISAPQEDAPFVDIREEDANGVVQLDLPEDLFAGRR